MFNPISTFIKHQISQALKHDYSLLNMKEMVSIQNRQALIEHREQRSIKEIKHKIELLECKVKYHAKIIERILE